MKRTQIYLDEGQQVFLEGLAFLLSRKEKKRVSISELIRRAIEILKKKYPEVPTETDLILNSPSLLKGIEKAKKEKKLLSHKAVFNLK